MAKRLSWEVDYFDTYVYQKDQDSTEAREYSGEFKFSARYSSIEQKALEQLVPDLQKKVDLFRPDIVAVSCISFEYEFLITFFHQIAFPNESLVIIGGIHATLEPEKVIETGLFDLVCIGEGEQVFVDILNHYEEGLGLDNIKSTYFYDKIAARVTKNPRRSLINQSELWKNEPDYSHFGEQYFVYPFDGKLYRRFDFEVARGCPYNCTYCGNTALKEANKGLGRFVRVRPLEDIKNEMKRMIDHFGIELFYFGDECFFSHSVEWINKFVEWYGKDIRKPFILQTRPETITEKKIDLIKQMNAPFFQISLGIESGSEKILFEVCNRKTKICKIIQSFNLLAKNEIRTCAFFMIGLPFETREDIFQSIGLCRHIRPTVAIVSIFQPLPGQVLRKICIEEGFITGNEPMPTFTGNSILKMPQISSDQIVNLRRTFLLYAYLPKQYYPQIEKCEKDYNNNKELYKELVDIRWRLDGRPAI